MRKPPKRRAPASKGAATAPAAKKKARVSKLARENDISGEEETEIREAFELFAVEASDSDGDGDEEPAMPVGDVPRALA